MEFEKSIFFMSVFNGIVNTEEIFTEYQIETLLNSSSEDYYIKDGKEYYRLYYQHSDPPKYNELRKYETYNIVSKQRIEVLPSYEPMSDELLNISIENEWIRVRELRNSRLTESDMLSKIYLPDFWALRSDKYKSDWLTYRQQLRDITTLTTNPFEIVWPEKPTITS